MKRISRPRLVIGALLLAYLAIACWVNVRSNPTTPSRPVTIRIAHWHIEPGPAEGIAAAIKRYEELNPQVHVIQMLVPTRVYRNWLRANFAGDNAPDIVEYGIWLEGMSDVPVRYFEPLTSYLEEPNPYNSGTRLAEDPWWKTFDDELYEQRMNSPEPGQYYAVTMTRSSLRFFTNRALLRSITGSDKMPQTLAEFRQVWAQTADYNRKHGRAVMPLAGSADNATIMMGMYMGGVATAVSRDLDHDGFLALYPRQTLWTYLNGEWSYHRPGIRAGLDLMGEFSAQMKRGYEQSARDAATREFLQGDALFLFSSTLEAPGMRRLANFPIDVMRLPQPTKDDPVVGQHVLGPFADGNNMTVFGLYLNKRSARKAASVDFLRFLTSFEGNQLFARKSGWVPSVRKVPVEPEVAKFLTPDDGYSYMGAYLSAGGNVRTMFRHNLHLLAGPGGSVEKFAAALDEQMPNAARADLQAEFRMAWLSAVPQDARIAAFSGLVQHGPDKPKHLLSRERLEAAQNQSEARALLIARQLELASAKPSPLNGQKR